MAKEYTLIGGNGTVVSPLEVTEDGDYVAGDSRAFNPVKVRTGSSGSSTLAGLTDVDISNPTDGQTLVFNATSGKWENGAGGGGLMFVRFDNDMLDKTWQEIHDAIANGIMPIILKPTASDFAGIDIINVAMYSASSSPPYLIYVLGEVDAWAGCSNADGYPSNS